MKGTIKVIDKDRGWKFLKSRLQRLDEQGVDIGYWGEDKYPPRPDDGPNAKVQTVVNVAVMNELGTERAPARPFMRQTFRTNFENLNQAIRVLYYQMIANPAVSPDSLLRRLGSAYRKDMQRTIADAKSWAVPNAPATVKKKGHDSPLLERYRMIARIKMRLGRRIDR